MTRSDVDEGARGGESLEDCGSMKQPGTFREVVLNL